MNTSASIFNQDFVASVLSTLDASCEDGKRITRGELCRKLELDESHEIIISILLGKKLLPGYVSWAGQYGGIGKEGSSRPKTVRTAEKVAAKLDPEFVTRLNNVLVTLVVEGAKVGVTRDQVAEALGARCSKTENMISQAFSGGLVPNFHTERGPRGGIFFGPPKKTEEAVQEPAAGEPEVMMTAEGVSEAAATETVPETTVAPEAASQESQEEAPTKPAKKAKGKNAKKAKGAQATA